MWILTYGPTPGCEPQREVTVRDLEFVLVGPGYFRMGSTSLLDGGWSPGTEGDLLGRIGSPLGIPFGVAPIPSEEMPVRWVEFPRGFAIAKREITSEQYEEFDEGHGRGWSRLTAAEAVASVSWEQAREYCAWLADESGRPIRLPTEAEWECACRAGGSGEYAFGDDVEQLGEYAWYGANSDGRTHAVATRKANAWGLHDVHGNVREWCEDLWHPSYEGAPTDGTARTVSGLPGRPAMRICRGGSCLLSARYCRSAFRIADLPDNGGKTTASAPRWTSAGTDAAQESRRRRPPIASVPPAETSI
jgi:formylglycine-generating enzyme required for sulfatase activity